MLKRIDLSGVITFLVGLAVFSSWVSQSALDFATGLIGVLAFVSLFSPATRMELFSNSHLNRVFPWMAGYFVVAALGYYFNGRPGADVIFCLTRFSWIFLLYALTWGFRYFDENRDSLKWFFYLLLIPALYGFNIFFNSGNDWLEKNFLTAALLVSCKVRLIIHISAALLRLSRSAGYILSIVTNTGLRFCLLS